MKKGWILWMVLILMTGWVLSVHATEVRATINNASAMRGNTVTFSVTLSEGVKVGSGAVSVEYDATALELIEGVWQLENAMLSTYQISTGKGAFAYQTAKTITGEIFRMTFRVKSDAPLGTLNITAKLQLKDQKNASLPIEAVVGTLLVQDSNTSKPLETTRESITPTETTVLIVVTSSTQPETVAQTTESSAPISSSTTSASTLSTTPVSTIEAETTAFYETEATDVTMPALAESSAEDMTSQPGAESGGSMGMVIGIIGLAIVLIGFGIGLLTGKKRRSKLMSSKMP